MPIFNGSAPAVEGEKLDHLQLYPNGGVGLLGQMGVPEAAVRAERWAWVAVTRHGHQVDTYVNGALALSKILRTHAPRRMHDAPETRASIQPSDPCV
jgi:hypothetical protein